MFHCPEVRGVSRKRHLCLPCRPVPLFPRSDASSRASCRVCAVLCVLHSMKRAAMLAPTHGLEDKENAGANRVLQGGIKKSSPRKLGSALRQSAKRCEAAATQEATTAAAVAAAVKHMRSKCQDLPKRQVQSAGAGTGGGANHSSGARGRSRSGSASPVFDEQAQLQLEQLQAKRRISPIAEQDEDEIEEGATEGEGERRAAVLGPAVRCEMAGGDRGEANGAELETTAPTSPLPPTPPAPTPPFATALNEVC